MTNQSITGDVHYDTSFAANLLSVSVRAVQNLVETSSLQACETKDGHIAIEVVPIIARGLSNAAVSKVPFR